MLLIVVAFRQRPDLVAAVVDPAACGLLRWDVLAFILRIDEEIWVIGEGHLHQTATELGDEDELHPLIGHLLRRPTMEGGRVDAAAPWCFHISALCMSRKSGRSQSERRYDQTAICFHPIFHCRRSGDSGLDFIHVYCGQC